MELTVKQILDSQTALQKLVRTKMKVGPAFWLGRQMRNLQSTLDDYNNKLNELIKAHGKIVDEKTGAAQVMPEDEGWPAFVAERDELLAQKVEIGLEVRDPAVLGDIDVEPVTLYAVDFLFKASQP